TRIARSGGIGTGPALPGAPDKRSRMDWCRHLIVPREGRAAGVQQIGAKRIRMNIHGVDDDSPADDERERAERP
ncbi:MAG: hypothetical protein ACREIV_10930, partial [Planctomycetaceae bacterium]